MANLQVVINICDMIKNHKTMKNFPCFSIMVAVQHSRYTISFGPYPIKTSIDILPSKNQSTNLYWLIRSIVGFGVWRLVSPG